MVLAWVALVDGRPSGVQLLALMLIGLGAAHLLAGALSGHFGPLMLTFWPFVIVAMGVAPIAQTELSRFPKLDGGLSVYYLSAQVLVLLAGFFYTVGYSFSSGRSSTESRALSAEPFVEPDPSGPGDTGFRDRLVLGCSLALSLTAFPLGALSGVSLGSRFESRDSLIEAYAAAGISYDAGDSLQIAVLKNLPTICAIAGAVLATRLVVVLHLRRKPKFEALCVLGLSALSFVVFANPLSNGRYAAFSGILAVVFSAVQIRTRRSRLAFALVLTLGLIVIYPAAAVFKRDDSVVQTLDGKASFTTVDFDSMQQTASALSYVDARGNTNGRIVASTALFFIPRSVWPGKSLPSSYLTTENRGYLARNLAQPLWSELYLDFGWLGSALLFFLMGYGSASLDRVFNRSNGVSRWTAVIAVVAAIQIGFLRGPMGAQSVFFAPLLFFVVVSLRIGRSRGPRSGRGNVMAGSGRSVTARK